ncbi:AAA family ATPase [Telmatocola sphagniphila]|uniref:AAA family ATPase n=1 Tax=Telmatocola sphagniphila TaxID=1123043 RepID=A0A8E6B944_9BACT|nr:AAA family ATPase [Telmatocola sphagniphila]QVL33674.1 AAA family ATPase [Telmatocola sphagniphila]
MSLISEKELAVELKTEQSVEAAYSRELVQVTADLRRGLPTLIECDKELAPFVFLQIRNRLKEFSLKCQYLDGRQPATSEGGMTVGLLASILNQLREAVRGATEQKVLILPHLDLLTTSQGGLTSEAREAVVLLYENPNIVCLGFKDPSFPLPRVIENLFPRRVNLLGIPRDRLRYLITQKESRKFGRELNPWALYKYVSGMNAVRLRRVLSTLEGEDYPTDPRKAYSEIRSATLAGSLEMPEVDLNRDIGGYAKVKTRLQREILDLLLRRERAESEEAASRLEELIPRGLIFWGPPGTGKTFFAKAMATAIGAAITIVSGPELKSKWVGESEENLRLIFHKARQAAPSIIVFDELDSFASSRGTYSGSGVEHSMVNQLLTEMDGFHKDELVFIVGTTNFVEALDPALLRPGRFEFHLHIPYPDAEDRRAILKIYDQKMNLQFTEAALEMAVKRTGDFVEGTADDTRFSGDHINALCRSIARIRLRENKTGPTAASEIEQALMEYVDTPKLSAQEELVVATHESGHAVCALFCPNSPPIERITIQSDSARALGYVRYQDRNNRFVVTRNELLDDICVLLGGREAESLLLEDLSIGSSDDLKRATSLARYLVEEIGMGGDEVGVVRYMEDFRQGATRWSSLSEEQKQILDRRVKEILKESLQRAAAILRENRALLLSLRDLLLDKKVIDSKTLQELKK